MASSTVTPELLRLSSTLPSPFEYFTDSTNTINIQADVILKVGNQNFYCHRLLLSLVSPVFFRMFNGQFKEHDEREIVLEGKSSESILELLKYIYPQFNGQITDDNIEDFLQLADEYMIEHLKQPCKEVLLKQLEMFHFIVLPTEQKLEQPTMKSENFHASDSALNSPGRSHRPVSSHRPTSSSRHTSASSKPSSSYLKPGDKHGTSSNTPPRYVLLLSKDTMPRSYDKQDTRVTWTDSEVKIWLRRLRILYQIDKGRNYGEVIDRILSILQYIPSSIISRNIHMTSDTYAIDEVMLNDIARARMHLLEEWASDGNPHRPATLTEGYRTLSPSALLAAQQSTTTTTTTTGKTTETEEITLQSLVVTPTDAEDTFESTSTDTDD